MSYETQVAADHSAAVGRRFLAKHVMGYDGDDQVDVNCDPPAVVVIERDASGLDHAVDDWLDPYWNVTSSDPRLSHLRSLYIYGPSYNVETGERDDGGLRSIE